MTSDSSADSIRPFHQYRERDGTMFAHAASLPWSTSSAAAAAPSKDG